MKKSNNTGVLDKEKPTPIEIKKIILEVGKCKSCGKEEIDLVYEKRKVLIVIIIKPTTGN